MSDDWRYWITYAGTVEAKSATDAKIEAIEAVFMSVHGDQVTPIPTIEVEEVGEGE